MRAVFVTTRSNDVDSVTMPWDRWQSPAARVTFDHMKKVDDLRILREVTAARPEVIFYIGPVNIEGGPSVSAFKRLRGLAPSIHICFDGVEDDWRPTLEEYRRSECFDLQVTIDGARSGAADLATLAPVDPAPYDGPGPARDLRCGFSGNLGLLGEARIPVDPRGAILSPLLSEGLVTLRQRVVADGARSYPAHVEFMRRCQIILNTSFAGSGKKHHVKQRVIESALAGCAILEPAASPIGGWFPAGLQFLYEDAAHAERLIRTLPDSAIEESARSRASYTREHYGPEKIYGEMLSRAGIKV